MPHLVLLGDSIFDNAAYVPGGSPLMDQLQGLLGEDWQVTMLAIDGAVTNDVTDQLARLPDDVTHLALSVGGNDALSCAPMIRNPPEASAALLTDLAVVQHQFHVAYRTMLQQVRNTRLPTIGCTVYDAVPGLTGQERMGLSLFNDVILRELIRAGMAVLDLRLLCDEPRDYSELSPIEPSETGGMKIARGLQRILLGHNFERAETVAYC